MFCEGGAEVASLRTYTLGERIRAIEDQMMLDTLKDRQRAQQAQEAIGLLRGMARATRETVATAETPETPAIPGTQPDQLEKTEVSANEATSLLLSPRQSLQERS